MIFVDCLTTNIQGNALTVHAPSFERNESAVVLSESLRCQYYTLPRLTTGNHPSTLDYAVLAYLCGDAKSIWFFEDGRCEPLPRFRSVWPLFHNSPRWSPGINSISSSLRYITRPSQPKCKSLRCLDVLQCILTSRDCSISRGQPDGATAA
jgi:hypothetical protein